VGEGTIGWDNPRDAPTRHKAKQFRIFNWFRVYSLEWGMRGLKKRRRQGGTTSQSGSRSARPKKSKKECSRRRKGGFPLCQTNIRGPIQIPQRKPASLIMGSVQKQSGAASSKLSHKRGQSSPCHAKGAKPEDGTRYLKHHLKMNGKKKKK